jgi:hypothetical protein
VITLIFIGASQRQQIKGIEEPSGFRHSFRSDILASVHSVGCCLFSLTWLHDASGNKVGLYKIDQYGPSFLVDSIALLKRAGLK